MTQIARRDTTVENWLASQATLSQLKAALPSHFAPERMARLALTSLRTVRGLAECSPASIMACVMTASQLGLEPGVLGSCYLIPRKGEATFLIGYQGLLDLIRRSGKVTSIASRVVYETDRFEIDYSASVPFVHKPDLRRKDNRILGFYTHATLVGGEHLFEWMPLHEVNAIRGRSQSGSSGPWATDFSEMGKKTVLRRAAKYLPRSIEFSDALAADDHAEVDAGPTAVVEVSHVEVTAPQTVATKAKLPAPPPPPTPKVVEVELFSESPEVVPFEDDGFPL